MLCRSKGWEARGPGGRCHGRRGAGSLFGGDLWCGSFFVGAIKGHGDGTNGDRGGLAGAINQREESAHHVNPE